MKKNKKISNIFISIMVTAILILIGTALLFNSNKERVISLNYKENDRITYKVHQNGGEYLDEGLEYDAEDIDEIEIKYYYDIDFSEKLNTTLNNYVTSNIKVIDENGDIIFEKVEELKQEKTTDSSNKAYYEKPLFIDYNEYKELVKQYDSESNNANLLIEFSTNQKSTSDTFNDILRDRTMTISIPLLQDKVNIYKSDDYVEESAYSDVSSKNTTNTIMFIFSIVSYVLSVFSIIIGFLFINKKK